MNEVTPLDIAIWTNALSRITKNTKSNRLIKNK